MNGRVIGTTRRIYDFVAFSVMIVAAILTMLALISTLVSLVKGVEVEELLSQLLVALILLEILRTVDIYIEERRVAINHIIEIGFVSLIREIIVKGLKGFSLQEALALASILLVLSLAWFVTSRYCPVFSMNERRS